VNDRDPNKQVGLDDLPENMRALARPSRKPMAGWKVLAGVEEHLKRYVIYPGTDELVAHVLWIGHAWLMNCWDSTPRLAFLSPEPGSGKSRALEVTAPLVPNPVHAVNATPAYLFRKVADQDARPTILFDEIDTIFGPKAKDNEELRGLLNAGHRKGAIAGRCVVRGKEVFTEELPAYSAVALAGLDDLPDTIMTRSVVVRMRRRKSSEPKPTPWRGRDAESRPVVELRRQLARWAESVAGDAGQSWPEMPEGVEDRDADVWEALLAVADLAGGVWPERARGAATRMVARSHEKAPSLGVLLLRDTRQAFTDAQVDRLSTDDLLDRLNGLDESPWSGLKGGPLNARGLSFRLGKYQIGPKQIKENSVKYRGYDSRDFADAWDRYLEPRPSRDSDGTSGTPVPLPRSSGTGVPEVPDEKPHGGGEATLFEPAGSASGGTLIDPTQDSLPDVGRAVCADCGEPMIVADPDPGTSQAPKTAPSDHLTCSPPKGGNREQVGSPVPGIGREQVGIGDPEDQGADDLCPICGYSLTLRAGIQRCAWRHKQAQAEAKKDGLS